MQTTISLTLAVLSIVSSIIGIITFSRAIKKDRMERERRDMLDREERKKKEVEVGLKIEFLANQQEKHETLLEKRMTEVSSKIDGLSNLIISLLLKNTKEE